MEKRFIQANKEARWSFGLPLWFEVGCISLPLVFIGLCILMVKLIFSDMPLEKLKDQD